MNPDISRGRSGQGIGQLDPGSALSQSYRPRLHIQTGRGHILFNHNASRDGRVCRSAHFLIKASHRQSGGRDPSLKCYATLSADPVIPGVVERGTGSDRSTVEVFRDRARAPFKRARRLLVVENDLKVQQLKPLVMYLCAYYLLNAKRATNRAIQLARFHLRNGARWNGSLARRSLGERTERVRGYAGQLSYDRKAWLVTTR